MASARGQRNPAAGIGRQGRIVTAVLVTLLIAYYLWAVRAAGSRFAWQYDLGGYYDLLARGFANGHLYTAVEPSPELLRLPDPWDPAANEAFRMQDMALFNRHYYLYFGAAPAVTLFLPWRLATGHDLPENFAVFLLCSGGLLCSAAAVARWFRFANLRPSPMLLGLILLALGLCHPVPFLLNRTVAYEVAIAGGYCFLSAAIMCLVYSSGSHRSGMWMAAAGLLFGLGMASRPHLALAAIVAGSFLAWQKGFASREFTRFGFGFAAVAAGVGVYNFLRFGNPLEFGFRYQLGGPGQNQVDIGLGHMLPGLYFLLFRPPAFSPVFPWVIMVFRHGYEPLERLPHNYFYEPTVGALWLAPMLLLAIFCFRHLSRGSGLSAVPLVRLLAASAAAVLLFLASTHLMSHRYEVDFLPVAVFAAVITVAMARPGLSAIQRRAIDILFGLSVAYGAVVSLALGIAGPYNDMLANRPAAYVRLAKWFSPVTEYRPLLNPDLRVAFRARVKPQDPGFREPLLSIGQARQSWLLYLEHRPGAIRLVSQTEQSRKQYDVAPTPETAEFQVEFSGALRILLLRLNGQTVFQEPVETLVTAPRQVRLGENGTGADLAAQRFSGEIEVAERTVREHRPPAR